MVLAAGRGERMRPLSDRVPKPALLLPGGPVVGSALRLASAAGCRSIAVNVWHLAGIMRRRVAAAVPDGVAVEISDEPVLMGTAGGLALARERGLLAGEGPVLVVNGDGLVELDLGPLYLRHLSSDDEVTLGLLPHPDPLRWSRVVLWPDGRVAAIRPSGEPEPDEHPLLYPGVMLVSRSALDRLAVEPSGTADRLWWPAMAAGRLGAAVLAGRWREVGTPAAYLEAVVAELDGVREISPGAAVEADAVVETSLVTAGCRIGRGAVVRGSVLAEGARVGAGAAVESSVLLGGVVVPAGERIAGCFLTGPVAV